MSTQETAQGAETGVTRAEYCVIACAEAWRGDGEVLASPMGTVPSVGARLAKLTFSPDLLLTDGEALVIGDVPAIGAQPETVEGWLPYRRHLAMVMRRQAARHDGRQPAGPARQPEHQLHRRLEAKPARQLLGVRGAPVNTINNPTSYWIPRHSPRVFVEKVDMVSGVGHDRAAAAGPSATRFHQLRRVVTDLAVLDFETPGRTLRVRSLHPGVSAAQVREATGFELPVPDDVPRTREPSAEELRLIRTVIDPRGLRNREVRT